jgi:lipoprotein NlpD
VNIEQIAVLNGIDNPDILRAGAKVFIPGADRVRAVSRTGGSGAPRVRPRWAAPRRRKGAPARGKRSARGDRNIRSKRSARRERSARRRVRFAWPVKGRLLRRFGTRRGVKYDGIAIRGAERAAAPGRVIFSDWGPGGLGRTVIIRHAGGDYHSVYAHNAINIVRTGQQVRRGAPIARLGSSGDVESARLHFEIRYRTKPRNPLTYLP